jgi:tetratricopeptide (TPR) repeat protein
MRTRIVFAIAAIFVAAATPAAANDLATCFKGNVAPDTGIAACSRAIAGGKLKGQQLAGAYAWRSAYYSRKGDTDRAIADADARLRLNPVDAFAFRDRSSLWLVKRDYERAIRDADDAIRLNPKDHDAWNTRAFARQQIGQYDGAIADYDQAIRLDPKDAGFYTNRGNAWQLKGDLTRALSDHDRAVAINPNDATYWYNRAGCPEGRRACAEAGAGARRTRADLPPQERSDARDGIL